MKASVGNGLDFMLDEKSFLEASCVEVGESRFHAAILRQNVMSLSNSFSDIIHVSTVKKIVIFIGMDIEQPPRGRLWLGSLAF